MLHHTAAETAHSGHRSEQSSLRQVDKKERPHHILPSKASNHTRLFELEEALAAVGAALLLAAVVAPGAVSVSAVAVSVSVSNPVRCKSLN